MESKMINNEEKGVGGENTNEDKNEDKNVEIKTLVQSVSKEDSSDSKSFCKVESKDDCKSDCKDESNTYKELKPNFDTLVLSGGGVKGFFLLGAIQASIDSGRMRIKNYVGCSVGAIICYLLAIGYTPIEIVVYLHEKKSLEKLGHFDLVSLIGGTGGASFSKINEILEDMTVYKIGKFLTLKTLKEEFGVSLTCVCYNMTKCCTEYLNYQTYSNLPCITALRMSCHIPFVFDRFKYMNNYYIDGGISDNFPILKGEEICGEDKEKDTSSVLGIYLEHTEEQIKDIPEKGNMGYVLKLLQVPIIQNVQYKVSLAKKNSTIIGIKNGELSGLLDFNVGITKRLEMFSTGYSQAKNKL